MKTNKNISYNKKPGERKKELGLKEKIEEVDY